MPSSTSNSDAKTRVPRRRVALVLALLMATLVLGNVLLYRVYHDDTYLTLAARNIGPERTLVFLGSSRMLYGIDPARYGPPNVSIAANYLDLASARELYEVHAAKLSGMRVAVIEFDIATLTYDTAAMNPYGLLDLGQRKIAAPRDWVLRFDASLHRVLAPIFNWRLTPQFASLHKSRTIEEKEPLAAAPGFIPSSVTMAYPEFHAEATVKTTADEIAKAGGGVLRKNVEAGVELVRSLRARGTRVVLLRFPLEPSLRKVYRQDWHELVRAKVSELGRLVGGPEPDFWDLALDERFPVEAFRDPDHLNKSGAARLAAVLTPRLAELLK